ncbi:hypothetical protein [Arthrobacter sp. NPDC058192]|uniref:hypothetical protein n=1 Tax=Arthrobacter sp. NPDC058192 TaxID=3346372 RepID=UPI0036E7DE12
MIPNHQQLISLLLHMEPAFLAGKFATDFATGPDADGERGTFLYFEGGYWDISIDGAARFQLAPGGSRVTHEGRPPENGPAMDDLPMRPPWSLVLPRCSAFLGRSDDDWQLNAAVPVVEDGGSWRASLTNMVKPEFTGTLTVDAETYAITRTDLGHMVQMLEIDRTEPTESDLAALETIKSTVQQFTGHIQG